MIPIYRFLQDDDPALEPASIDAYVSTTYDGTRVKYMKFYYNLACDPVRNNDPHTYLATDPYGRSTNIVGFLKYEDEPLTEDQRKYIVNPQDYFQWSDMFRGPHGGERLYKVPFITSYEQINANQVRVGGNAIFNSINCPPSGVGTNDVIINGEYIRGKQASCDHPNYPNRGCPPVPVVANLGRLMPSENRKELNFIGNSQIKGILVYAVAPPKSDFQYLSNPRPIKNEHIVSDYMELLKSNPDYFTSLLN